MPGPEARISLLGVTRSSERVPIHGFSGVTRRSSTARSSRFADASTPLLCFGAEETREASSSCEVRRGCEGKARAAVVVLARWPAETALRFVTSHERGAPRTHATAWSRGHRCPFLELCTSGGRERARREHFRPRSFSNRRVGHRPARRCNESGRKPSVPSERGGDPEGTRYWSRRSLPHPPPNRAGADFGRSILGADFGRFGFGRCVSRREGRAGSNAIGA